MQVPSEEVSRRICSEPACISGKGVYEARCSERVGRVTEPRKFYSCGPLRITQRELRKADGLTAPEGKSPGDAMASGEDTTGVRERGMHAKG